MKNVQEDFAAFQQTAPDPKADAEREKKQKAEQEKLFQAAIKAEKAQAKKAAPKKPAAEKAPKDDGEAEMKKRAANRAKLVQRLMDYVKFLSEFHPDRLEFLNLPKDPTRLSEEDLQMHINMIEADLGKKASFDVVIMGYVQTMKLLESTEKYHGQPLRGLEEAAKRQVTPTKLPNGQVVPGPAVPTLAEFAAKYSYIFSTGVEIRLALMIANTVVAVRNANAQVAQSEGAAARPSVISKDKMEDL